MKYKEGLEISRKIPALRWHRYPLPGCFRKNIDSPIIGSTKAHHLEDVCGALDISLTEQQIKYLEESYIPHNIIGFE
jgi:hypothetical protein